MLLNIRDQQIIKCSVTHAFRDHNQVFPANLERPLDLVTGSQDSSSERSPLDSRLSKDSNQKKRAAIPTSPVLTQSKKIFPR